MALSAIVSRALCVVSLFVLLACGGETTPTEVFLSVEAEGAARAATSVRVEVNALVIEFERMAWPLELLVLPADGDPGRPVAVRAWAFEDGRVTGAGTADPEFKAGARTEVRVVLVAGADVGAVPNVNADAKTDRVLRQPMVDVSRDAGFDAGGTGEGERDAGTLGSDAGSAVDDAGNSERDAGAMPYRARLLGTWTVRRAWRTSNPCVYASSYTTTWEVTGSASALSVVAGSDRFVGREEPDGSFELAGSKQTITGTVSDESFTGVETNMQPENGQPCTVTRTLTGER